MGNPNTVGIHNFKWLVDSGGINSGISLVRSNYSYGTYSMGQTYGTQFTPQVNQKFVCLQMQFFGDSDNMQIYDSTSVDSATGTVLLDTRDAIAQNYPMNCYFEIANGHYINITVPDPKQVQCVALGVLTST